MLDILADMLCVCEKGAAYLQIEPLKRGVVGGTPEVAVAQHLGWCWWLVLLYKASVSLPPTDVHTHSQAARG